MKKLILIAGIALTITACTSNEGANDEARRTEYAKFLDSPTTIEYDEEVFNFGEVKEGEMVKHTFKFTNTGDEQLILVNVNGSCGCTVPESWPKHPIAPGEGGEISVVFNTNDRVGKAQKSIRIEANTAPVSTTAVQLVGTVVE
ncbi:DUF1573 domain-containing protein [Crocinitomix catalasitica]|uniref:DUF1573 domain-containing protein n=1 Tax=Crocinitomix catalasitica TaxID=184607 RepID=UPI000487002B|nr:DUF1573 domain-containing protein [Crocinitomix catalasitica]